MRRELTRALRRCARDAARINARSSSALCETSSAWDAASSARVRFAAATTSATTRASPRDAFARRAARGETCVRGFAASARAATAARDDDVDIDGDGLWGNYRDFKIPPGETISHDFPAAFSACWLRAVSDRDTTATVLLKYR